MNNQLYNNYLAVENRKNEALKLCANAQRDITIVAVSKTFSPALLRDFLNLNVNSNLGESKGQELRDKVAELSGYDVKWHFIGPIQRNKLKYIVPNAHLIHSVESVKTAKEIDKRAAQIEKRQRILLQVNISAEEQKHGFMPDELEAAIEDISSLGSIEICGLMGVAKRSDDERLPAAEYARLRKIFEKVKTGIGEGFKVLSMGMSGDFETAIKEGSNMIRVGSAIFGQRDYSKQGGKF